VSAQRRVAQGASGTDIVDSAFGNSTMLAGLRLLGMCDGDKFILDAHLLAKIKGRLQLLAGLIDNDGYVYHNVTAMRR